MTVEYEGGRLTVGSSYSLKIPGSADYTAEEQGMWMSIAIPVAEDVDMEKLMDQAFELEEKLTQDVKLAVFTQLHVNFHEVQDGVLVPSLDELVRAKPAPKTKQVGRGPSAKKANAKKGSSRRGGGDRESNRKIDPDDIPTYSLVVDGEEVDVQDLRPIKEQGIYAENAADFRIKGTRQQYWLYEKDGSENEFAFELADLIDSSAF